MIRDCTKLRQYSGQEWFHHPFSLSNTTILLSMREHYSSLRSMLNSTFVLSMARLIALIDDQERLLAVIWKQQAQLDWWLGQRRLRGARGQGIGGISA